MNANRNRLIAPRNVVNTKMLYSFYILKELSKGEVIFGNKVLEAFKDVFQNSNLPFQYHQVQFMKLYMILKVRAM